jgi:hypothetical protein
LAAVRASGSQAEAAFKPVQIKGNAMTDLDFTPEELREQASANQSALWHMSVRWARDRDGTVDGWATFVGGQFAPSWDELGDAPPALRVARAAALNLAAAADVRPVALTGDDSSAEVVVEGPDQQWLDDSGTTQAEHDRANELVFRAIVDHLGLTLDARRDDAGLHLVFKRRS